MGCDSSKPAHPVAASAVGVDVENKREQKRKSRIVDSDLKKFQKMEEKKIKMLLLGAGESGKSTIFKQMRLLYGAERDDDDMRMFGVAVRSNILVVTRKLCVHLRSLGLEGELDSNKIVRQAYDELIGHLVDLSAPPQYPVVGREDWVGQSPRAGAAANNDAEIFLRHHKSIQILWQAKTMRKVWAKRAAINAVDSHSYFLDEIPRIASSDYKPTTKDMLVARIRTTHIIVEEYKIDGTDYEMYDVGGQRSERRKWINCFAGVTAVIFVAALSEYDQTLAEAKRSNRMVEALILFQSVCSNMAFKDTSILLFLNKRDIFQEKILHSHIAAQKPFIDFAGPAKNYDAGVDYFTHKFKDCLTDDELNDAFIHVTCATDTSNMEFVLSGCAKIIKDENVARCYVLGD